MLTNILPFSVLGLAAQAILSAASPLPQPLRESAAVVKPRDAALSAAGAIKSKVVSARSNAPSSDSGSAKNTKRNPSGGDPKLVGWWGQSNAAGTYGLDKICADGAFDTVIISFLTHFFGPGGHPVLKLSPLKNPAVTVAQKAAGATGLIDGSPLTSAIKQCQAGGKKVMLSLGGADASGSRFSGDGPASSVFANDDEGDKFAQTLWDLFLGGGSDLRPFGDVKLDGIDIDTEAGDSTGYVAFTKALRSKFAEDSSKKYVITAAPGCLNPDASISMDALRQCDYVWPQFYNSPRCQHGSAGFMDAVQGWSKSLGGSNAKLYIAGNAWPGRAGRGYLPGDELAAEAKKVQALGLDNFGGYALWDASLAMRDGDGLHTKLKAALS